MEVSDWFENSLEIQRVSLGKMGTLGKRKRNGAQGYQDHQKWCLELREIALCSGGGGTTSSGDLGSLEAREVQWLRLL